MTAHSRGEDLFCYLSADSSGSAPSHFREEDLAQCRGLVQDLLAEHFARGYDVGQEDLRQAEAAPTRRPATPSVKTLVLEGARTLFLNIPSILLVGFLFQLFQPLLNNWATAFAVLEVARGPLKVGGDYVFNLALSGIRLNWRKQATLTGGVTPFSWTVRGLRLKPLV